MKDGGRRRDVGSKGTGRGDFLSGGGTDVEGRDDRQNNKKTGEMWVRGIR